MAIVRAPLKSDATGKCSRWRVILYNPAKHKQEWHTIAGTLKQAKTFERAQQRRIGSRIYIPKAERRTFAEVATMFLKEREARNRRAGTLDIYESVLRLHLLTEFGLREVGVIQLTDCEEHFGAMRAKGATIQTINRSLRVMKAVLFFAMQRQLVERNVVQRFEPFEGGKDERHVRRGAFNEAEVQAIIAAAKPRERAFIALLVLTGLRPGEVFGLDWTAVDLDGGSLRVVRSWDPRGQQFVPPKTKAGDRVVPLAGWLVAELRAHRQRTGGEGLVFPSRRGGPMNPSNVRRDIWLPLIKRAGVRALDMYSLRHTFASLGRVSGESAFNVSRMMGHARSTIVDTTYAHTLQSGMASVAESVAARALGVKRQLRVIEGGTRDVREPLETAAPDEADKTASA
jgi:integrase